MTTFLRPMSIGQVLDRTFNLYRSNFVLFFGIALLPAGLVLLVRVAILMILHLGQIRSINPALLGFLLLSIIFAAWLVGYAQAGAATVYAVSAVHLGRKATIAESYKRVRGRYGRMFNLVFSILIRVAGFAFLTMFAAIMLTSNEAEIAQTLGTLGSILVVIFSLAAIGSAIIGTIYLFLRYAVAVPACVLEDIRARASLKRSVQLTKGDRGRIFVICFLVIVLNYAITIALVFLATTFGAYVARRHPVFFQSVNALAFFLAGSLTGPIATIALSLVYYDERVRKEAFDLELMMASMDKPLGGAVSTATS
jgi:glycerophosphoryl diester phosphodiesterase family protein